MGFKIGDKVVCNRGSNTLRAGKEYIVRALDEDMDVAVEEVPGYWAQDRFVLVPRQQDETMARMVRKCDNCGAEGKRCTRRVYNGVVVWDCLKCWTPADVQVDREIQKEWLEKTTPIRQTPQVRCAICHVKAPRAVVHDHPAPGNILRPNGSKAEQNNLNGWGLMEFPFRDDYFNVWTQDQHHYMEGVDAGSKFAEKDKLCPKCATKVKAYIAHLSDQGVTEEDL